MTFNNTIDSTLLIGRSLSEAISFFQPSQEQIDLPEKSAILDLTLQRVKKLFPDHHLPQHVACSCMSIAAAASSIDELDAFISEVGNWFLRFKDIELMKQMGVIVQKSIDRNNGADFKLKDPLKVATVMTMSALNTTFVGETVQIVLMGRFVGLKLPNLFDDKGQSFFFAFLIGSVDGGDWGKDPEPEPTCPIAPELVPS